MLAVDAEEGAAGGHELAQGRNELEQAVRAPSFLDELSSPIPVITPDSVAHTTGTPFASASSAAPLVRVAAVEQVRVSLPTSSISAETRSAWPMWWT